MGLLDRLRGRGSGFGASVEVEKPAESPVSEGDGVRAVQLALHRQGYPPGRLDGRFGPATEAAVRAFQHDRGLPPLGDVDDATGRLLLGAQWDKVIDGE